MGCTNSMFICPICQQRVVRMPHSGDLVHECNSGNSTLDQEDVIIIGDWVDFSGEGGYGPMTNAFRGTNNDLRGTIAGIEGGKDFKVTDRGARASTHRQRQRLMHFDFDDNKLTRGKIE